MKNKNYKQSNPIEEEKLLKSLINFFHGFDKFFEKGKLAQSIITLAKYSYESAFVIDYELNIMACALELKGILG